MLFVKILISLAAYALCLVLVGAIAFGALMALAAEGNSLQIGFFAEFVVLFLGWVMVLGLPAYAAAFAWRQLNGTATRGMLATLREVFSALILSLALAIFLLLYDCFVEGTGHCPTWVTHLLVFVAVLYVPATLCLWVAKSAIAQWREWRVALGE